MTDKNKMPDVVVADSFIHISNGCVVRMCLSGDVGRLTGPHANYIRADLIAEKDPIISTLNAPKELAPPPCPKCGCGYYTDPGVDMVWIPCVCEKGFTLSAGIRPIYSMPVQDFIKELEDEGHGPAIAEGRKEFEKFKSDTDFELIKKATSRLEKILQEKDRRISELLEANNRYLERARKAEAEIKTLRNLLVNDDLTIAYMKGVEDGKDEANRKDGE